MRIAVNTRLLVPEKMDGIARFSYETLLLISKQNPDVEFVFIFDRKVKKDIFSFPNNISFVSLSPPARHPILWYIWFEIKLKNYLNRNHFDLFLSPEGWVPGSLRCKSLAVMHDLNFEHFPENIIYSHRKYLQHFFPKFAKRADRIATVSKYSKLDISKTYGIVEEEIDVVYNGANEIFKPIQETLQTEIKKKHTNGDDFFLFIGTLHPRKNLEHLFLAFDIFKRKSNSKIKLLIVGNKKWWPQELEKVYQSLMYKNDIVFMGRMTDAELSQTLASALALTYLPYFEGFGIPILEAFQCKTAVITSNVTSMPEVAEEAALLCEPRNSNQIAEAMLVIATDNNLREKLIQKGEKRAQNFSWEKSADLLWKSIQKTMNK